MAGIKFTADVNVEGIIKLRQEIDKLKKSLIAVAGIPNSDAAIKQLEKEISSATKKLEEYENKYLQIQKLKHDIDSSNAAVKKAKEETAALQSTNKWIVANTEAVIETDKQIKQLKKSFVSLADSEKTGTSGTGILRQVQQLAAQRLVEEESIRRTIKAQKDQIIQSRAEEGSITALRKQLILLTKDYDDLGRTRRNGDAGKALLAQIANVQKELSAAEQASGRFQRNVGNYASAWNGLGFSVQQVARELPSLAVSANTFFLAISNNLPILVDEIAKARKEYAAFKAELAAGNKDVKAVAPVWQQLTKSLISWQTALVVGLTLLSVYGKDVIKWIGSLGKARDVTLDLLSAEQEMALARKSAWSSIVKEQTQLDILYSKLKNVTLSTTERNAAVREWVKNYKTHSDILDGEKVSIDKLNKAYKELTKEIRNSAIARKYEDTLADMSIKREDEEIKRLNQKKTLYDAGLEMSVAQREYERVQREYDKGQTSSQVLSSARVRYLNAVDNWNKEKKVYVDAINTVKKYDENMAVIENHISTLDLFPQPKEGTYDYWQQQVQLADTALKQIKDTYLKTLKSGSTNGVPEEVIKQYNALIKQKTEAEEKLKLYDDKGLTKEYNSIVDQQKKISELLDKQTTERKRKEQDLENQLTQSRIDAMAEGEAKIRAQRELDNKKEIQDLERQREDYIRTEIELQRKAFDEQENLRAKQIKNYKKKTFDPSTVKVNTSVFDGIIGNTSKKQLNDKVREQEDSWNEYLIKYGLFTQKKEAIDRKYKNLIEEASDAGKAATLQKEWNEAIANLDFTKLKQDINWEVIFGDLSKITKDQLKKVKQQLQDFKKSPDFKKAQPEQIKVIEEAINSINDAIVDKGGFFGGLTDSLNEYEKALIRVKEAQEEYDNALKTGDEVIVEKADNQRKTAEQNLISAKTTLDKSKDKAVSNITAVSDAIGKLGSAKLSLSDFGSVIGNLVDVLSSSGTKIGGLIASILSIIESVGEQGTLNFAKNLVGNIVDNIKEAAITDTEIWSFGLIDLDFLRGADYSHYNEMKEEYENLNKIWDELIDKKKEYIDMSYGPEAAKAGDEAIEIAKKSIESYKLLGKERLQSGASAGSHSIGVRVRNSMSQELWDQWDEFAKSIGQNPDAIGGRLTGLFDLTAEQLEKLKEDAPGFWSKLDGDVQDYLNKIIEGEERIEDIQKAVQEQLTQTSFDSLFDSFIDTLMDMDSSSKDFADNFGEYMRKAVFTQMFAKGYEDELRKWYESFSAAMGKEGGITSSDIKDLREGWDTIVNGALEDRKAWEQIVGGGGTSTSQESSKKGFATMSQDSADELNGRFTALQIAGEEIKNQNQLQTMSILELKEGMLAISANSSGIKDIASETRDLIRLSYEAITDIRDNTNVIVKPIQQMAADIAEVKRNTNGLSKK